MSAKSNNNNNNYNYTYQRAPSLIIAIIKLIIIIHY